MDHALPKRCFYGGFRHSGCTMAMGTLVLEDPLFYYRYHAQNLYSVDAANVGGCAQYEMTELVYSRVYRTMIDWVFLRTLLQRWLVYWIEAKRWRLEKFGGAVSKRFKRRCKPSARRTKILARVPAVQVCGGGCGYAAAAGAAILRDAGMVRGEATGSIPRAVGARWVTASYLSRTPLRNRLALLAGTRPSKLRI